MTVAELLLKIGNGANYEDGDIVCAFNDLRIQREHAFNICFERDDTRQLIRRNSIGLIDKGDVAQDWCEQTHEYRMERLSKTEARMTRISDGESVRFQSNTTFTDLRGKNVQMDIDLYVRRRADALRKENATGLPLFGSHIITDLTWYGGRKDLSQAKIDAVWSAIETKDGRMKADFPTWPLTDTELRHFLALPVDDFNDVIAADLVAAKLDEATPTVLAKRKYRVNWTDLFPLNIPPTTPASDVTDRTKVVDPRPRSAGPFSRSAIVLVK